MIEFSGLTMHIHLKTAELQHIPLCVVSEAGMVLSLDSTGETSGWTLMEGLVWSMKEVMDHGWTGLTLTASISNSVAANPRSIQTFMSMFRHPEPRAEGPDSWASVWFRQQQLVDAGRLCILHPEELDVPWRHRHRLNSPSAFKHCPSPTPRWLQDARSEGRELLKFQLNQTCACCWHTSDLTFLGNLVNSSQILLSLLPQIFCTAATKIKASGRSGWVLPPAPPDTW